MADQARLFETAFAERTSDTLVISVSNARAWRALSRWRDWPCGALALIGPDGGGKTHMAQAWREVVERDYAGAVRPIVVDDADRFGDDAQLSLLLDEVRARGGPAVLVGRGAPKDWVCTLPDLKSRLSALPVAILEEPDEALLERVLERLCRTRFMKLEPDAAAFLARRMDRSFSAARALAARLETIHDAQASRPIGVRIASRALRGETKPDPCQECEPAPDPAEDL